MAENRRAASNAFKIFYCTKFNGVSRGTRISFIFYFNTTSAARRGDSRGPVRDAPQRAMVQG